MDIPYSLSLSQVLVCFQRQAIIYLGAQVISRLLLSGRYLKRREQRDCQSLNKDNCISVTFKLNHAHKYIYTNNFILITLIARTLGFLRIDGFFLKTFTFVTFCWSLDGLLVVSAQLGWTSCRGSDQF